MSIELWKQEIEEIKEFSETLKSNTGKSALNDAVYKLKKLISDEENRLNSKLKTEIINGKKYHIPYCLSYSNYDEYTKKAEGGVLYCIDNSGELEKDNSYHWWHYAWIPNGNKYTQLLVRTLGGDRFGDRYFAETSHYKHPADHYTYQTRHLAGNNQTYKIHIEYILKELGLLGKSKSR